MFLNVEIVKKAPIHRILENRIWELIGFRIKMMLFQNQYLLVDIKLLAFNLPIGGHAEATGNINFIKF